MRSKLMLLAAAVVAIAGIIPARAAAPANDDFANAAAIGEPSSSHGDTTSATNESGEPSPSCSASNKTLWYRYDAPAPAHLTLRDISYGYGGGYTPVVAVYTGSSLGTLSEVACGVGPYPGGPAAFTAFDAVAGQTYFIQAGGANLESATTTVALYKAATIRGRVTDEGGAPASAACIHGFAASGAGVEFTSTAPDGTYQFDNVFPDDYRIEFQCPAPGLAWQWYLDKASYSAADVVPVADGVTVAGIDAVLHPEGVISGRVTDTSGTPLAGICVDYQPPVGASPSANGTTTGFDGTYRINALPAGKFLVHFSDCGVNHYLDQWYRNASERAGARAVTVRRGAETKGIDAVMRVPLGLDLAVTKLTVTNDPPAVSAGTLTVGITKVIHVEVRNVGDPLSALAGLTFTACPHTAGACQDIFNQGTDFKPGERKSFDFDWNPVTSAMLGDVTITARIDVLIGADAHPENNARSVESAAVIGGTGVGVGLP